jgi:hypothetical protein
MDWTRRRRLFSVADTRIGELLMIVNNGGPDIKLDEAVLFPFDKWSMPFRYRVKYGLIGGLGVGALGMEQGDVKREEPCPNAPLRFKC